MNFRPIGSWLVLGFASWLLPQAAQAETLPRSGMFDGYYHRDRLGVGHFLYFCVAPELHEKLTNYEGKRICLRVTKAEQPINPGDAIMLAIGRIEELPQPPLRFSVKTRPSPVIAGRPFQVILELSDTRRPEPDGNPAGFSPEGILLSFRQPRAVPEPDADKLSLWFREYTNRQLAVDTHGGQIDVSIGPFQGHRANLWTNSGPLELRPGNAWAWVVSYPVGVARVDGEVHVTARYLIVGEIPTEHGRTVTPMEFWQEVHVQPATPATSPSTTPDDRILRLDDVKLVSTGEDGWSRLQFTLLPATGRKVRVPGAVNWQDGKVYPDRYANVGRLEAFAADGTEVELEARRVPDTDPRGTARKQLVELPQSGAAVTARFRKQSRFAPAVVRLTVSFVTEAGVDTLTVSDNYRDLDVTSPTPFGSATDGVKMRVRPIKATFKAGTPVTFHVQAMNVSGKPVCWWGPDPRYGGNFIVEVDGRPLQLPEAKADFISGWAADWTCQNPNEWTTTLPETVTFAKGRHVLRYIIVSKGGTYLNADQKPIPLVKGRIVSNEATFSMQ